MDEPCDQINKYYRHMKQTFYSNGKLLITGEYLVLDGAQALALPTRFGQSLEVTPINEPKINWKSYDIKGKVWLDTTINLNEITSFQKKGTHKSAIEIAKLISILKEAQKLNPNFLRNNSGFAVNTYLDFPRNWGLGSSSTLINNIASWANVDAFTLLKKTFGGSGYDIAAAQNNHPIIYQKTKNNQEVKALHLNWNFTHQLFFVHLNKKQNSSEAIKQYELQKEKTNTFQSKINDLTSQFTNCKTLEKFEYLIVEHEALISKAIKQKPIKERLFSDFKGSIKSLGAWGGDFILATGNRENQDYFRNKGYQTILTFQEMILSNQN